MVPALGSLLKRPDRLNACPTKAWVEQAKPPAVFSIEAFFLDFHDIDLRSSSAVAGERHFGFIRRP